MAEEDAFSSEFVEGCVRVDYSNPGNTRGGKSGANQEEVEVGERQLYLSWPHPERNFNNYKMVDERPVMEQYHELLRILGQFAQHDMKMDESISVSSIIDKLPPSWRDVKHNLKHQK
ncbi:hypothetical protein HanIR_Chr05g0220861 [Helianthus annuus]|nr:hypothetical protein HanIR_Chr05g0220861 [Helianthus annuus]